MDKSNYRRNAKFLNKPKLKPISGRDVHVRHQIVFIDMSKKGSVKMNEHLYRYDLTVIDAFSRFLWLRTLESKSSLAIASELESIYMKHGSLQGGKFKRALKLLCDRVNIKLIYSHPRHPQSQGKVECCHRTLRPKMEYDLQKNGSRRCKLGETAPFLSKNSK